MFKEADGTITASQQQAFLDSWDWMQAAATYDDLIRQPGTLANIVRSFHDQFGPTNLLAYLVMMAPRLIALRDTLKPTGSLYLHCDPTASQYLKVLLDAIFGPEQFVNEIVWKRSTAHSDKTQRARHFERLHDITLLDAKTKTYTWNHLFDTHEPKYVAAHYPYVEATSRRFGLWDMTGPGGAANRVFLASKPVILRPAPLGLDTHGSYR